MKKLTENFAENFMKLTDKERFPDCSQCQEQHGKGGPTHEGSKLCNGWSTSTKSIAAGGTKAHCTCDACF